MQETPSKPRLLLPVLSGIFLLLFARTAGASILWDGDAATHTPLQAFSSLNIENQTGEVNVLTDPTYGAIFQFVCYNPTNGLKTRTEGSHMKNFQPLPGNTYYFGWRHKWGPLPTKCGKWQVLEQIHLAGTGATGGPVPFGLHVDGCDTDMHFQYQDATGTPHDFLVLPFPLNTWHSFVYHERWSESETDGYVEFWYDGVMQTLANGTTRYPSAWCFPNSTSYWKWGVYRSGSGGSIGTAYAYLWRPRAGTTYADVAPDDIPFVLAAAPGSQTAGLNTNVNFSVTLTTNTTFSGTVAFSLTGLPANTGASFSPASLGGAGASTLSITTSNTTPLGVYTLTISGTTATYTNTTTAVLVVSTNPGALPGTLIWTDGGGANTNWSTGVNWTNATAGGTGSPGPQNDVVFTNLGTANSAGLTNNYVDASFAIGGGQIASLQYANTNNTYHTTLIAAGQRLVISNNTTGKALLAGTASDDGTNATASVNAFLTGASGELDIFAPNGFFSVSQGGNSSGTFVGAQRANLNLSGLGTLNATVSNLFVGVREGAGLVTRACGVLYLAHSNTITVMSAATNAIVINDNGSGNGSGLASALYLGQNNQIFADALIVGRQKAVSGALLAFNPALTNGSTGVSIRGYRADRVAVYSVGDGSFLNTSQPALGTNDFTGGTVDAMADGLYVGRGTLGSTNTSVGVLTFTDGTIDANTLEIGYQNVSTAPATGIVNVNGSGATLQVNGTARLGRINGGTAQGTLNVVNGTFSANTILHGGGGSTISLSAATLILTNSAGAPGAGLGVLNVTNSALHLNVNGATAATNIIATALNAGGVNTIALDLVTNVTDTNTFPLVAYSTFAGSVGANFSLGALPPGYSGTLVDNSAQKRIDVTVVRIPRTPPQITTVLLSPDGLVLQGTNGLANTSYNVLESTNIMLPLTNWSVIGGDVFDGTGGFNFTNPVDPNAARQFYLLQSL